VTIARATAILLAIAAGVLGVWRGTWAVGGSDSSCYALMAKAFAEGSLQPMSALAPEVPWTNASATFAPGGFIPSPTRTHAASPVCMAGFSVLLAPLHFVAGADAIFWLTPLAGGLLIYVTYAYGRQLAGDAVGLAAAAAMLTAPVFVFQVVQPMNDVLVALLWTTMITVASGPTARTGTLGALTGLAILVRPNLAPAAVVFGLWCSTFNWRRWLIFAAGAAPFILVLLWLNAELYGNPLQSGYGTAGDLFSLDHLGTNLRNYGRSLWSTELGFPLLGTLALIVVPREQRRPVAWSLSVALAMVSVYLVYRPFAEWWYLRFLLPALPVLTVLAMSAVVFASRRKALLVPVVLALVAYTTSTSAMKEALDLQRIEQRFRVAGTTARDTLPSTSVFLTVWESGSVAYHGGREAVVWDALAPQELDAAIDWLVSAGREPYIMIEDWEEPAFRERFSPHADIGKLDWPPAFDIERRVKIYRPADRARFLRGETVPTEFVRRNRR
jgi:energy-converting hydrogenase Eha subunit E